MAKVTIELETWENKEPTKIDKELFEQYGLYPIERRKETKSGVNTTDYITYAIYRPQVEEYPQCISEENADAMDMSSIIKFDNISETVDLSRFCSNTNISMDLLSLLYKKAEELKWERF